MKIPWISILVTLVILYLAATRLDWVSLGNALQQTDPVFLYYALGTWVVLLVLKGLKWKWVVQALQGGISFFDSVKMLLIGLFIGVITPGRVGDFVRAAYVKKELGLGRGILGVFIDRIEDVFILLVLATVGLMGLFQTKGIHLLSDKEILVIFFLFGLGIILSLNKRIAKRIWKIILPFIPPKLAGRAQEYGKQFYDSVPLLRKNFPWLILSFLFGILAWLATVTFGFFLMQSAHIPLDWNVALLVVPILALVEIIPLGIAGLGTRELASVVVLGAYSITPELAVIFSLLYFAFGYIPSFVLGAIAFNYSPFPIEGGLKNWLKQWKNPSK